MCSCKPVTMQLDILYWNAFYLVCTVIIAGTWASFHPCSTHSYMLTTSIIHIIKPNIKQIFLISQKALENWLSHWDHWVLNQRSIIALEIPGAVWDVCFWWGAQLGADQVKIVCCGNQLSSLCFPDAVLFATLARYLQLTKESCSKSVQLQISA